MKLIIARHGEIKEGKKGIILGGLPGNLSIQGKKEAKQVAEFLINKKEIPEVIISSNLKRAKDSALIIGKKLKVSVIFKKIIKERKAGKAEGKTEKEIDWEEYEKLPLEKRKHKSGESFHEVKERAEKFLKAILKNKKYQNILIISHDVFIKMLLSVWLEKTIKKSLSENLKGKIIIINTTRKKKAEIVPL